MNISRSPKPYDSVDGDGSQSRLALAYYLRTLAHMRRQQGSLEEAIESAQRLLELYDGNKSPDALRLKGDALAVLVELYGDTGETERQEEVIGRALKLVEHSEVLRVVVLARANVLGFGDRYRRIAQTINYTLGYSLMRAEKYERAIALFEKALLYGEVPLYWFFLAGTLLKGRGDRAEALSSLRRAIKDPRHLYFVHRLEAAFLENPCFAEVHEDPEFLAVIREGASRYKDAAGRRSPQNNL